MVYDGPLPIARLGRLVGGLWVGLLAACHGPGSDLKAFQRETLVAGQGLGSLRLGSTTLGEVAERWGVGVPSLVASDELALELTFAGGQLELYFPVQGACADSLGPGDLLTAVPRLRAWLATHPTCRQLPLTSVSVGLPHGLRRRWYRGKTERGVGLGSSLKEVLVAYGPPEEAQPQPVAGTRPRNDTGVWEYPAGMQIFFRPEKAQKLEEAQVVRMVLFLPQRSHSGLP